MLGREDDLLPEEVDLIEQDDDDNDDFDAIDEEWFKTLESMETPSCNMDDPDECLNCGS
jgi:hypothetical protein